MTEDGTEGPRLESWKRRVDRKNPWESEGLGPTYIPGAEFKSTAEIPLLNPEFMKTTATHRYTICKELRVSMFQTLC